MNTRQAQRDFVRWLANTKDLAPNTVRAYGSDLEALCLHMGVDAHVRDLSSDAIVGFIESQRSAGLSGASIRRRMSTLRAFSRWLISTQQLDMDPWTQVAVHIRKSRTLPRPIPPSDLKRLLSFLSQAAELSSSSTNRSAFVRPNDVTTLLAVALMFATGLRVGEVVGIRWLDVDISSYSIRVMGKGFRERTVFLPDHWMMHLLGTYLDTRLHLGITHEHLLFNCAGKPLTAAAVRARLARVTSEAGIQRHITPHMLRHSAATQLIESGVDIRYVQRLLGHASLSTTEIYTHVSDLALRQMVTQADVLGKCLAPS